MPSGMGGQGGLFGLLQSPYLLGPAGSQLPLAGLNEILIPANISGILHVGTLYQYRVPVGMLVPPLAPALPPEPQQ